MNTSYYALNKFVAQCEQSLLDSKNRFFLPPDSAAPEAVLTTVALSVNKKNIRCEIKPESMHESPEYPS